MGKNIFLPLTFFFLAQFNGRDTKSRLPKRRGITRASSEISLEGEKKKWIANAKYRSNFSASTILLLSLSPFPACQDRAVRTGSMAGLFLVFEDRHPLAMILGWRDEKSTQRPSARIKSRLGDGAELYSPIELLSENSYSRTNTAFAFAVKKLRTNKSHVSAPSE